MEQSPDFAASACTSVLADEQQTAITSDMIASGIARERSKTARALATGRAAETRAGGRLTGHFTDELTDRLVSLVRSASEGRPGRHHTAAVMLGQAAIAVDPKDPREFLRRVARIVIRNAINAAADNDGRGRFYLSTASHIGNDIADEVLADKFASEAPGLFNAVVGNAKKRGASPKHQAAAVRKADRVSGLGMRPDWPAPAVGCAALDCLVALGSIVGREYRTGRHNGGYFIVWANGAADWFAQWNENAASFAVQYMPTVVPPTPWTGLHTGGYPSNSKLRPLSLIKSHWRSARVVSQEAALASADLSRVYAAINAVQATPWRINTAVLSVMNDFWSRGIADAGLPSADPEPLPEADAAVRQAPRGSAIVKAFRKQREAVHLRNRQAVSDRLSVMATIRVAEKFATMPAIYFPHQLDYRGRMYAVPTRLSPQGNDMSKGLLTFATGKVLGRDGAKWLAIHGANLYGKPFGTTKALDKMPFADRIAWAYDARTLRIVADIAADPVAARGEWVDADKPWQFLAWALEWAAYHAGGQSEDFVSFLPIAIDGTCNGLQHFAAMLRDPVAGAAVNLMPCDMPQDIYQRVADVVVATLKADAVKYAAPNSALAAHWLAFGVDRSTVKQPTMTMPYGVTAQGRRDQIKAFVAERIAATGHNPFGHELSRAVSYFAKLLTDALNETVLSAPKAMKWLQDVARKTAKAGHPVAWTTPSGFVVVNDVRKTTGSKVRTYFHGSATRVDLSARHETDKQDTRRHAAKIAPDFVHSLDAAHLVATVNAAAGVGVSSFAMIHDSYGTHAADTSALAAALRDAFVGIYDGRDVLADFASEMPVEKLPKLPSRGDLDIKKVAGATYFFA